MQHISVRYVNTILKNYLEEWFAPSIEYKIQHHVKPIEKLKYMLPVDKIAQEIAFPDTQNVWNPKFPEQSTRRVNFMITIAKNAECAQSLKENSESRGA